MHVALLHWQLSSIHPFPITGYLAKVTCNWSPWKNGALGCGKWRAQKQSGLSHKNIIWGIAQKMTLKLFTLGKNITISKNVNAQNLLKHLLQGVRLWGVKKACLRVIPLYFSALQIIPEQTNTSHRSLWPFSVYTYTYWKCPSLCLYAKGIILLLSDTSNLVATMPST